MQHLDVLDADRLVKIMQEFTMEDQMDTNKFGRMDIGAKFKARAAIDIAKTGIYNYSPFKMCKLRTALQL